MSGDISGWLPEKCSGVQRRDSTDLESSFIRAGIIGKLPRNHQEPAATSSAIARGFLQVSPPPSDSLYSLAVAEEVTGRIL